MINPLVSFVCVIYNHSQSLVQRCINSIHENMKNVDLLFYDIIIVNNNALINNYNFKGPHNLITPNTNTGYCGGNNIGISSSKSDYIIIINPDIKLLNSKGIERMIQACNNNYISGRLVGAQKWYAYPASFPTDKKYVNCDLPYYMWEHTLDKPGNWRAFKYIDGSLMAFPKSLWKDIGGFDEDFFPGYFGETAFAFKAYLKYGNFILQDCDIENTYLHDNNDARLDMSVIDPLTQNMRLLFYYKYALNNWDKFKKYLDY